MTHPAAGFRAVVAPPESFNVLSGALEFAEDAAQGTDIWRIAPVGGSSDYLYELTVGSGMYQLSTSNGPDVTLQRGPSGTPVAGNPEPFTIKITDKWGQFLLISQSCNVLDVGGDNVAPLLAPAGPFTINDSYVDNQFVFNAALANNPVPAATRTIDSQSIPGLFAINSTTGDVRIADADLLVAGSSPTVTVRASNGVAPDDTETYTVNVVSATADAFLVDVIVRNDSLSEQPIGSFAAEIGHYFREGDIPAGSHLEIRAADSTTKLDGSVIRFRTFYPDGSLKFAGIMPKLKTAIPAGGSQTIKLFRSSVAHGGSGFSVASAFAGTDFKVEGEMIHGYTSGLYVASFNDALAGVEGTNYWIDEDSEGGMTVTGVAPFKLAGVAHAQLRCKFFIQVLKDNAADRYGWIVEPAVQNGYHGVTDPPCTTALFKSLILKNGSTTLMELKAPGTPPTFTRHPNFAAQSVAVANGGSGYALNQILTVVGGTGTAAQLQVTGVSGGVITSVAIRPNLYGNYSAVPANPVSVTGGTGTGATFNITWGQPFLSFSSLAGVTGPDGCDRLPVHFTSTGVLPAPLTANTGYFFRVTSPGSLLGTLHLTGNSMHRNLNPVFMTDAGSGVHTMVPGMAIEFYDAGKAFRTEDGRPVFVPGTGSTEPLCWAQFDNVYRVATRQFGPRDLSINPNDSQQKIYKVFHQGGGAPADDFSWFEDTTGERLDIGYKTAWDWIAFHKNNYNGWKRVLRNALLYGSHKLTAYERPTTNMFVNNTNKSTYAGLGPGIPGVRIRPTGGNDGSGIYDTGATAPAAGQGRIMSGGGPFPAAHAIFTNVYAYEMTGNPFLLHFALASCHRLMLTEGARPETINGIVVDTSVWSNTDGQMRSMAWDLNAVACAARICPANYRGTQLKAMFLDIIANCAQFLPLKHAALLNSFMLNNKFWWTPNSASGWQLSYMMTAAFLAYEESRNNGIRTIIEDTLKFLDNIRVHKGAGAGTYLSWYNFPSISVPWLQIDSYDDFTVALSGVNGGKSTVAMIRACIKWAKAYGFTVPAGMEEAADATFVPDDWRDPVYALTGTFNQ